MGLVLFWLEEELLAVVLLRPTSGVNGALTMSDSDGFSETSLGSQVFGWNLFGWFFSFNV